MYNFGVRGHIQSFSPLFALALAWIHEHHSLTHLLRLTYLLKNCPFCNLGVKAIFHISSLQIAPFLSYHIYTQTPRKKTNRLLVDGCCPKFHAYLKFWFRSHISIFIPLVRFVLVNVFTHTQTNIWLTDLGPKFDRDLQFLCRNHVLHFIHLVRFGMDHRVKTYAQRQTYRQT